GIRDFHVTGVQTCALPISINHLNIGIPVSKHMGMTLGFMPVSHIYYKLSDTAQIPLYGNSVRTFFGDGSLNYAYAGLAGKYKGRSEERRVGKECRLRWLQE